MTPHPNAPPLRVAYVLKRFPRLSETFIINELLELERQGVTVEVYSLMRPPQEARHALLEQLQARVFYLPRGGNLAGLTLSEAPAGTLSDGASKPASQPLSELLGEPASELTVLFAGKSSDEIAQLWLQASTLALLCAARGIAHLHAHFASNAALVALLASRQSAIPYSFTAHARDIYHTYVNPEADDQRRRQLIHEAAFVTTVSDYNCTHLAALALPADRDRIQRLYNGIELGRFTPPPLREVVKPAHFIAVGRLVEKKGYPDLIEACRLLAATTVEFRLSIIGDGPDRAALEAQIAAAGIAAQVELLGACTQQRVIDTMATASALILPCVVSASGDRDGLPTALLEAMAMGLPTISTLVAGVPEIIDQGRTGWLVPQRDPVALAEAMAQMLEDPQGGLRMGSAGRCKAEQLFDLQRNVRQLNHYFRCAARVTPSLGEADAHRLHCG